MFELTKEQINKFDEDGYLIVESFLSPQEVESLKAQSLKLSSEFDISTHPLTKFHTGDKGEEDHVGDDYFLNSGDKIRYFFEPNALDKDGSLVVDKAHSLNKIGHALHVLDPVFKEFTHQQKLVNVAKGLSFKNPVILQSMIIFKQPSIGASVPPHQDSTFLYTDPVSAHGMWFPLEDCTLENGYLSFVPGSHKSVPITKRFVRNSNGKGTKFEGEVDYNQFKDEDYVKALIPAGSLVIIHGSVVHKSEPNLSKNSRIAYTFHFIEKEFNYPKDNWLQPSGVLPFSPLY